MLPKNTNSLRWKTLTRKLINAKRTFIKFTSISKGWAYLPVNLWVIWKHLHQQLHFASTTFDFVDVAHINITIFLSIKKTRLSVPRICREFLLLQIQQISRNFNLILGSKATKNVPHEATVWRSTCATTFQLHLNGPQSAVSSLNAT